MLRECAFLIAVIASLFSFTAQAQYAADPLEKDNFAFREPSASELGSKLELWATYYYLPQIKEGNGPYLMRDMKNQPLGPSLSLREWCEAAMEGSVRILSDNGTVKTLNYAGTTTDHPVDCSSVFRFDVSKTKFREAKGPFGDGIEDYILAPYRTLATDKSIIPPGSVIYIPEARGAKITLSSGRVIIHDGYFFAGDRGGAIKGNHVDVFIGTHKTSGFFPWIKSRKEHTFSAYTITDKQIIAELSSIHLGR